MELDGANRAKLAAALGRGERTFFVAGLPGMGKSMVMNALVHLATAQSRGMVQCLQWDVARPVIEEISGLPSSAQGETAPVVRRATGLWALDMLRARDNDSDRAVLIGETPFVGGRLSELLVRGAADDATFVVPVRFVGTFFSVRSDIFHSPFAQGAFVRVDD